MHNITWNAQILSEKKSKAGNWENESEIQGWKSKDKIQG